ncbi:general substrate transporter [Mollisia scopiformis]|uniref:General substrate transporter n=1 Tax=Mollisia scopiformis TaxID=149040 RepID=A0A194XPL7_MOLSC|nr:general substrate transporter [Mollisia scopiformis]KUJ22195.1 general substrate transporter [Mollisia scopiformis]
MPLSPKTYQFLVGVFASFGSFLYGYDLGVIAGVIASPAFLSTFNNPSANETGAVVSVFTGGAFFGAALAGPMGDWFGRRLTIMTGALIFCVGGSLQTAAQNLGYLYAGRAIAGLAEIAHSSIRGRITGLQQFVLAVGALVATWTTFGTNLNISKTSNAQWRIPLAMQLVPAIILALLILLFPESPRWLIDHGKPDQGLKTLARLHANGDVNNVWVRSEYEQIEAAITHEHEEAAKGYVALFKNKSSFRRLLLVLALQASVQMTGVSAIQYFSPTIYATLGIGTQLALKYQGISNALSTIATICTILFIDRLGRRWPLIIGNLINCVCFIIVTAAIAPFPTASPSASILLISFSFTCGSLSWIIPAEIFDTHTRSKGVSLGAMMSFAFSTMIGQVTKPAIESISWRYFILFVVCNFTNALFFWAFMPETAKRPLEEMNALFSGSSWFVPTMKRADYDSHDLEYRVAENEQKDRKTSAMEATYTG